MVKHIYKWFSKKIHNVRTSDFSRSTSELLSSRDKDLPAGDLNILSSPRSEVCTARQAFLIPHIYLALEEVTNQNLRFKHIYIRTWRIWSFKGSASQCGQICLQLRSTGIALDPYRNEYTLSCHHSFNEATVCHVTSADHPGWTGRPHCHPMWHNLREGEYIRAADISRWHY